jgi:hypothetical protein
MKRIPFWAKATFTVWVAIWLWLYATYYPTAHFLWMCHVGNVVLVAAFWLESPLLFSWQAVALLAADLIWTYDVCARLIFGIPLKIATYIVDPSLPIWLRVASLFHAAMPWILIWGLWRFGYDRRAFWCQLASCSVLFPLSYWLGNKADNINWVHGPPFAQEMQQGIPPLVLVAVAMLVYPLVMSLLPHLIFMALARRPQERLPKAAKRVSDDKAVISASSPPLQSTPTTRA